MRTFIAVMALALSLSACASLQPPGGNISSALTSKETFDRACQQAPSAYALFLVYDAARPVDAGTRKAVRSSYRQITKVCKNPPASLAEAAIVATRAYERIRRATTKDV